MGGGGSAGTIMNVVGTGMSMYSSYEAGQDAEDYADDQAAEKRRVARQNKELAYEDALIAEEEANRIENATAYAVNVRNETTKRTLGTQMARYAKSGVVAGSGTPTQVMARSKASMEQDIQMVKYNGKTASQEKRDLARRFRKMGDQGLSTAIYQGMLLESAAADQAEVYNTQAIATGVSAIGNIMTDYYEGQQTQQGQQDS